MVAGRHQSCWGCPAGLAKGNFERIRGRPATHRRTAATQCSQLFRVVLFRVVLRRLVRMLFGISKMRVGHVRVVRGLVVITCFMVLRSFRMMMRSKPVMMSCLLMVFDCLLRHRGISISARRPGLQSASMNRIFRAYNATCVTGSSITYKYALKGTADWGLPQHTFSSSNGRREPGPSGPGIERKNKSGLQARRNETQIGRTPPSRVTARVVFLIPDR